MTQKYLNVRRDLYEQNPASRLNLHRSFADMARIFKLLHWALLALTIIALISILAGIVTSNAFFSIFALVLLVVLSIVLELPREKHLYHETARKEELARKQENYLQYLIEVKQILSHHEIKSPEKRLKLKQECETALRSHTEKYRHLGNKTYDLLIGVPLGALVSSIIYAQKEVALYTVILLVLMGFACAYIVKAVRLIRFYTDGYFKDQYLLDALNELDYSNETAD